MLIPCIPNQQGINMTLNNHIIAKNSNSQHHYIGDSGLKGA
jgi:hypothetical protein